MSHRVHTALAPHLAVDRLQIGGRHGKAVVDRNLLVLDALEGETVTLH